MIYSRSLKYFYVFFLDFFQGFLVGHKFFFGSLILYWSTKCEFTIANFDENFTSSIFIIPAKNEEGLHAKPTSKLLDPCSNF